MTNPDTHNATAQHAASPAVDRGGGVRQLIEALICLSLAVILFRAFQVEGYMISTGSMAPTLFGFHKRVVCPSCRFPFAVGDVTDKPDSAQSAADEPRRSAPAFCPNCGQGPIDVSRIPRSQGDQLLVHKHAFLIASPKRWEVAVFRNPYKPAQAYVKRVVGLPGESIQVIDGDVYIGGKICRKHLAAQRAMRIPVYDDSFRPEHGAGWQDRWTAEPARIPWTVTADGFQLDGKQTDATGADIQEPAWMQYWHWVRSRDREPPPRLSPVADVYGYNRADGMSAGHTIRDLMLSVTVQIQRGDGQFIVQMTDGDRTVSCVIDPAQREVRLLSGRPAKIIRRCPLAEEFLEAGRPLHLEVSLFDRQALVTLNGQLPFEPWPFPQSPGPASPSTSPVRFGARGLNVAVSEVKLFRDVFYTRGRGVNGIEEAYQLGDNEYFVLGDNSPVSLDSRSWSDGALSGRLFIGKPFLVHLPSKPGKIRFGNRHTYFRVPDFSRIQYIR
jgi:signal peptidase I